MGFGFNLFFAFVFPIFVILSLISGLFYLIKGKYDELWKLLKGWGIVFGIVFLLVGTVFTIHFFTDRTEVTQNDIYGNYVIDKSKYAGKQQSWQYDHFRFEITRQDSIFFYITDKKTILKTYRGKVQYSQKGRIILKVNLPRSAVIVDAPTLYRNTFSFYYVFHSKYYNNVFFKKGDWE
jgi:hypothetical protein